MASPDGPRRAARPVCSPSMFILYAIPVGLLAGWLAGGRLERLADVRFRLAPLAVLALAVQLVLFSPLADGLPKDLGRAVYVISTALVVIVVLANVRLAGVPLVVLGAVLNLAAIVANGGAMPARPEALAALGYGVGGNTNSVVLDHPVLEPLTDVFAMPAWMPLANVFSAGDVLIGLGIAIALAAAMRGRPGGRRPAFDESAGPPAGRRGGVPARAAAAPAGPWCPVAPPTICSDGWYCRPVSGHDPTGLGSVRGRTFSAGAVVQGKPVARRGRKARDLPPGRPPGRRSHRRRPTRGVRPP